MKTIVISGASSGIGHSMVELFSKKGWNVIMVARNQERLQKIKDSQSNTDFFVCDLSQPQQVLGLKEKLKDIKVDALINNAGIFKPQSVADDQDETWEVHFQSNMMSAVRLTRALWEQLKDSKGCILNISSTLGIRPIANTSAYSALKAAMNNWTLGLAIEGANFGVRANAICPGIVDTPIHSYHQSQDPKDQEIYQQVQKAQPLGRTGKPQDIAHMALQMCDPTSEWMTGSIINIDGGILLNS